LGVGRLSVVFPEPPKEKPRMSRLASTRGFYIQCCGGATSSDTSLGSMVHKEPKKPEPKEKQWLKIESACMMILLKGFRCPISNRSSWQKQVKTRCCYWLQKV
jgi:hypothetical protein